MSEKSFKISRNKLTASILAFIGIFILTAFILSKVAPGFKESLGLYVIISLAVGAVVAVLCAIFVKEDFIRILDDGFEHIKGNKKTKYSFSDFAGSNVTRHYMNGIYYGTSREISVKKDNGKKLKINANNLSKDSFAELVAYLGKNSYMETHNTEVTADYFMAPKEFNIPKKELIEANRKSMILKIVFMIACLVVCLPTLGYYLITSSDSPVLLAIMVFSAIGSVILAVDAISSISRYKKIKTIPDLVYMDRDTLGIDKLILSADKIQNISMVPASYTIMTRDLIVITKDNNKYKFNFGKNDLKGKTTYAAYGDMDKTIELWCLVNEINFMHLLG